MPFQLEFVNKLFAKILSFSSKQLLTQICLAISTLVLLAVEHGKPIEKLFYSLQNLQSQDNGNTAVLEMLTVLPEIIEDQNNDCRITSARRYEYGQEVLHSDSCNCQSLLAFSSYGHCFTLSADDRMYFCKRSFLPRRLWYLSF